MATANICAELQQGFDLSCVRSLVRKYHQEAVIINWNDIDRSASTINVTGANCDFTTSLVLKPGKTGVRIKLPSSSNSIKGFYAKSKNDNGFVQYLHTVNILSAGLTSEQKCILDKLDHGRFVVALQASNDVIEIYGFENGLSTGDYTFDIVENGGPALIPLQSDEDAQEQYAPLVYKPRDGSNAVADFDSLFAA
ncbi:hypothetical protein SAMN05443429_11226 [Cruoricaptor ignavus]|uniref:Uncharacterized protein n=1 Tax=Cruoricaptor ignavus TaxID=1118202 RepID=A0A1M6HDK3_9FLAO|nr:hypothetical protein [Cruoricaptor ignavus]SHJ20287.1 hypothetical protein SAMN05443429_11226 [Cruoricaptor ignavus]